jgi:integrase/recombinase XerC
MTISDAWVGAIAAYLRAQRGAGWKPTTLYARRQQLEHLARRVGPDPWSVTGDDIEDYVGEQEWAQNTRRSRYAALVGFYDWGVRRGHVSASPAVVLPQVAAAEPYPNPVPDDVYLAALLRADADEALWIDLAAEHGLRRAEIAQVHSDDLRPTLLGWDLTVHGKGGKLRVVPLTSPMAGALLERGAGYAFPGGDHGHVSPRWLGRRVSLLLGGVWTIHKLRHRAASRFWVMSGEDPYAVADLMGWANLNMVRVYVRLPSDRLRRVVEGASKWSPVRERSAAA